MKTVTEFSAFELRRAHGIKMNLIRERQKAFEEAKTAAAGTVAAETTPTIPSAEAPASEPASDAKPVSKEDAEAERRARVQARRDQIRALESAVQEALTQALTTEMKLEGERLNHFLNALQVVDPRRARDLRRVVVMTLDEKERLPLDTKKIGEHFYKGEYLAPLDQPRGRGRFRGRNERGGGRKGRGGRGRGRDGERTAGGRRDGRGDGRVQGGDGRGPRGEGRGPRQDRGQRPGTP